MGNFSMNICSGFIALFVSYCFAASVIMKHLFSWRALFFHFIWICVVFFVTMSFTLYRVVSLPVFFILAQPNWPLTVVKLKEVTAFEDRWIRSSRRLLVWTSECFFATNCFLFVTRYRFVREINFIHSFIQYGVWFPQAK